MIVHPSCQSVHAISEELYEVGHQQLHQVCTRDPAWAQGAVYFLNASNLFGDFSVEKLHPPDEILAGRCSEHLWGAAATGIYLRGE